MRFSQRPKEWREVGGGEVLVIVGGGGVLAIVVMVGVVAVIAPRGEDGNCSGGWYGKESIRISDAAACSWTWTVAVGFVGDGEILWACVSKLSSSSLRSTITPPYMSNLRFVNRVQDCDMNWARVKRRITLRKMGTS